MEVFAADGVTLLGHRLSKTGRIHLHDIAVIPGQDLLFHVSGPPEAHYRYFIDFQVREEVIGGGECGSC